MQIQGQITGTFLTISLKKGAHIIKSKTKAPHAVLVLAGST